MLIISAERFRWLIKAVRPFVSTAGDRPALECIRISAQPDQLLLEATDSYALARAWTPTTDGPTFEAVVEAKQLRSLAKSIWPRGPQTISLDRDEQDLVVVAPYGHGDKQRQQRFVIPLADFNFPSTEQIVTDAQQAAGNGASLTGPVGFSPWLLARLNKVPCRGNVVLLSITDPHKPVLVTWPGVNLLAVLMPAKISPTGGA